MRLVLGGGGGWRVCLIFVDSEEPEFVNDGDFGDDAHPQCNQVHHGLSAISNGVPRANQEPAGTPNNIQTEPSSHNVAQWPS